MSTEWYVKLGEKHTGPYSAKQLKKMATEGQITPQASICKGKNGKPDGNWKLASKAKGLFGDSNAASQEHVTKLKNESAQSPDSIGIQVTDTISKPRASNPKRSRKNKRQKNSADINPADVLLVFFGLILCFPIGLFVLWSRRWSVNAKSITTFAWLAVVVAFALFSQRIDYNGNSKTDSSVEFPSFSPSNRSSNSSSSASETGLTLQNYNRVRMGMSESDAKSILGYSYETTSENSFGEGEFKIETKVLTWSGSLKSAVIIFQKQGYDPEFTVKQKSQFNLD